MVASREFSAGGVVVREHGQRDELAVIKPAGRNVVALPKGHIDAGETARQAAAREVLEETGLTVTFGAELGDVKYVYRFHGKTIFKVVSFFLFHYAGGVIDDLTQAMRVEVDVASWLPLDEAARTLTYQGERDMAARALALMAAERAEKKR